MRSLLTIIALLLALNVEANSYKSLFGNNDIYSIIKWRNIDVVTADTFFTINLNTGELHTGMYFIDISVNGKLYHEKIIKP